MPIETRFDHSLEEETPPADEAATSEPRAAQTRKRTRIQQEKERVILNAALDVFSENGFRGTTIDQIAQQAGLSKPNLLYYFRTKEDVHRCLLDRLLDNWLEPLRQMQPDGDPLSEIRSYMRRKLELARDYPRESRLFANEMIRGAPHLTEELKDLKALVDEKAAVMRAWMASGKLATCDPHHLIFSIWATTQHYADFDTQVRVVLARAGEGDGRFEDAARFLDRLYLEGLKP